MTRQSATPVPFMMAYTNPNADVDVSAQMRDAGLIEPGLTWLWHLQLKEGVRWESVQVMDVGANFGWYTLLSAAMGCEVVAWEPVPYFAAFLKYGLLRNNLVNRVHVSAGSTLCFWWAIATSRTLLE